MNRLITSLAIVASMGLSIALAEDAVKTTPATQPAASTDAKPAMKVAGKVLAPYSKLETFTADQKAQIIAIQNDAKERIKKIEDEQEAKIEALLTPEQKATLDKMEADHKEAQKEKNKERRDSKKTEKSATEKPADATPAAAPAKPQ